MRSVLVFFLTAVAGLAQARYDILLKNGHLLDARNGINAPRDVAIKAGKIAAVAPNLNSSDAVKTIDLKGL